MRLQSFFDYLKQYGVFEQSFNGQDIYKATFEHAQNQEIYFIKNDNVVLSYCILENNEGWWWLMESASDRFAQS